MMNQKKSLIKSKKIEDTIDREKLLYKASGNHLILENFKQ